MLLCALLGMVVNMLCFFKGIELSTPINSAVLITITPILVFVFSAILIKERLLLPRVVGVVLGFIGALVLIVFGRRKFNAFKKAKHVNNHAQKCTKQHFRNVSAVYFLLWNKKTYQPKQNCCPQKTDLHKAKPLNIGWHYLFGNGMVKTVYGCCSQRSQKRKRSFIHQVRLSFEQQSLWRCLKKPCYSI